MISMMDGFLWYNQVSMIKEDTGNTTFTILWGTFMYDIIPFGIMNVGSTFQHAMYITFVGEIDKFIVIYLDDMTIFSKTSEEHLSHLKQTFKKYRKYGLFLNPKNSSFSPQELSCLGILCQRSE